MSRGRDGSDRDQLIRLIQSEGFGLRASDRAVRAVFATMARALRRGEVVEIPGGRCILSGISVPGRNCTSIVTRTPRCTIEL